MQTQISTKTSAFMSNRWGSTQYEAVAKHIFDKGVTDPSQEDVLLAMGAVFGYKYTEGLTKDAVSPMRLKAVRQQVESMVKQNDIMRHVGAGRILNGVGAKSSSAYLDMALKTMFQEQSQALLNPLMKVIDAQNQQMQRMVLEIASLNGKIEHLLSELGSTPAAPVELPIAEEVKPVTMVRINPKPEKLKIMLYSVKAIAVQSIATALDEAGFGDAVELQYLPSTCAPRDVSPRAFDHVIVSSDFCEKGAMATIRHSCGDKMEVVSGGMTSMKNRVLEIVQKHKQSQKA